MHLALALLLFIDGLWTHATAKGDTDVTSQTGHLQPFGCCGARRSVAEHPGFLSPSDFVTSHAQPLRPVVMRGAARDLRAYGLWTDAYLLKVARRERMLVNTETVKKESRQQRVQQLELEEFLLNYNHSEHYMVDSIPAALRKDVELPFSLQCNAIKDLMMDAIVWFSSGGTKSVVHTDAADNLNCVLRGSKQFVLIDPSSYDSQALLDQPQGAYSAVDVDSVDFRKYPSLAEAEYLHAELSAGDCLYIPFKWIHQVRSVDSNLAVNFWFYHAALHQMDLDSCRAQFDRSLTMDTVTLLPAEDIIESSDLNPIRHLFVKQTLRVGGDFTSFSDSLLFMLATFAGHDEPQEVLQVKSEFRSQILQVFLVLDHDRSGLLDEKEILELSPQDWVQVRAHLSSLVEKLTEITGVSAQLKDEL